MNKLNKPQSDWLKNCANLEPIYMYINKYGNKVYFKSRLGSADVTLTNRLRSLDKKGLISYREEDNIIVTFNTKGYEDCVGVRCVFKGANYE